MPDSERAITTAARALADLAGDGSPAEWYMQEARDLLDAVRPLVVREEHDRLRNQFGLLNVYKSRDGMRLVSEAKVLALLGESTQEQTSE